MPGEDIVELALEITIGRGVWHHVAFSRFKLEQRVIEQ